MSTILQSTTHYGCYVEQHLPALQNGIRTRKYVLCERFMNESFWVVGTTIQVSVRMRLT